MQDKKEEEISSLYKNTCIQNANEFVKDFSKNKLNMNTEQYLENGLNTETIEEACEVHGIDVEDLIKELNK